MNGSVIRGDLDQSIEIGESTYIGENVVVHVSSIQGKKSTKVGNGCYVGCGAILHGCEVKDGSVIGQNATGVKFFHFFHFFDFILL